jgi:hypothetical protein
MVSSVGIADMAANMAGKSMKRPSGQWIDVGIIF